LLVRKYVASWDLQLSDIYYFSYVVAFSYYWKFHVRGYSPSFFSAIYLEGSKIGEVFPGGS